MPFRHNVLGALVAANPKAAHKQLASLFKTHGSSDAVASALSVDTSTLGRWIKRLQKAGLSDPRSKTAARTRRNASAADRAKALALRDDGLTVAQIAEQVGYNAKTVARWFRQAA